MPRSLTSWQTSTLTGLTRPGHDPGKVAADLTDSEMRRSTLTIGGLSVQVIKRCSVTLPEPLTDH